MRRLVVIFGLALVLGLPAVEANADWHSMKVKWHAFWDRVQLDWHRNNAWPEPFNLVDQKATRAPFNVMIENGWRLQNTIPDPLFNQETQQLSKAGQLKVRWILTQMPIRRRNVFVLQGRTPEITQLRLESVRQAAVSYVGQQGASMVSVTETVPRGGSGAQFDRMHKGFRHQRHLPNYPR